jgi:hydrogenase expression/formation protein HypC
MCLAIPGRVTAVYETNRLRMGKMDFGGVLKEVCLAYLPDLSVGNYAIVHVGFAISKVDEEVALETLRNFRELGLRNEEFM